MDSPHRGQYTFTWTVRHHLSDGSTYPVSTPVTGQRYGIAEDLPDFISFWQWLPGDVKQLVASFPLNSVVSIAPASPDDAEDQHHAETWASTTNTSEVPF